jgi:hypothetical protein
VAGKLSAEEPILETVSAVNLGEYIVIPEHYFDSLSFHEFE